MNPFADEIRYLESGIWAEIDPEQCPCHGSGWCLSDLDVHHKCPIHGFEGLAHPENDLSFYGEGPEAEAAWKAEQDEQQTLRTAHFRKLYEGVASEARNLPYPTELFNRITKAWLQASGREPTPENWLHTAVKVLDRAKLVSQVNVDFDTNPETPADL